MAERFSPKLSEQLTAISDLLSRQVYLMGWFLSAYARLPADGIIRFKDLIRDPDSALSHICPGSTGIKLELDTLDLKKRYPSVDFDRLRSALEEIDDLVRHFYPAGMPH